MKPLLNFSFCIIHRSVLCGILPFIILKPCQGEWGKGRRHLIEAARKLFRTLSLYRGHDRSVLCAHRAVGEGELSGLHFGKLPCCLTVEKERVNELSDQLIVLLFISQCLRLYGVQWQADID